MKKLFILLIAIPYFLTAQVKKSATPKSKSSKSRFSNTRPNSNRIASTDFEYDLAGNVTKDLTQGISKIDYVSISRMESDPYAGGMTSISVHLPEEITFTNGRKIKNQYDATGTKLLTQLLINNVISVEYQYEEDETYIRTPGKDWKLIEIKMDEGRLVPKSENSTEMVYEYDIEDHTGSPRVSFRENTTTGQAEIVRKQDYDPFGLLLKGIDYQSPALDTLSKKYFFNGKEYLVTIGLNMYDYGLRTYNPRLGRFYQIDPKASMMPSWSPYSFSFDNPVRFRDYDGQIPYPITIRSFAPFSSFGLGFHGDNRGYSTSASATARVHQRLNFDTDKNYLTGSSWSSPTWHTLLPSYQRTATAKFDISSFNSENNSFNFSTHASAGNPITPKSGTPDIDVFSDFSITSQKGSLSISGKLTGDNFPSTEAFISDPGGQNVFLGIGQIGKGVGKDSGPFTELPNENRGNPITSFNLTIGTDKIGNFTNVTSGGKTYTIDNWNKMYSTTSPTR